MIVPMKKAHILSLATRRKRTTQELGELGIVHVTVQSAENDRLSDLRRTRERIQRALRSLPETEQSTGDEGESSSVEIDPLHAVDQIIGLVDERRELDDRRQRLEMEAEQLAPWEDLGPADLEAIEQAGLQPALYVLSGEAAERFTAAGHVFTVYRAKDRVHFLVIAPSDAELPDGAYPRPSRTLSDVEAELGETRERCVEIDRELLQLASHREAIERELDPVERDIEFESVRAGMQEEGKVLWFTGWVPAPKVSALRSHAKQHGWGLLVTDPGDDEEPPVLVERRGVSRLIKPVFDLINTTPGYRERDISLPFLLFLTVFFAMILSDAGYGLLLLVISVFFIVRSKVRGGPSGVAILLLTVMSAATVVWGAMSGVWFGYEAILDNPFFAQFVVPEINAFSPDSIEAVIAVCFVLALIQLTLARIWNFVTKLKEPHKLKALAELGWLAVLGGVFNLALTLVVSEEQYPFLPVSLYLVIGGLIAVLLFANQDGNFLKGVLAGFSFTNLIATALDGINAFADTMSYLRLFAVGLASVEIAAATNELAALAGEGLGFIPALLIIVFGHSLNLAMGGLSVLVHGVRLNMLEFSGALGMEWSGSDYRPFRYNT